MNVHIISHSHWDREWYMPFEYHRSYLIELIDNCIKLFETDPDFKGFHLDGHTALVEDYLEIKPQNREKIAKLVAEGKFGVGPWYVLQDEFLTSGEANVRNLLVGMDIAKKLGNVTRVGYFPDAFGNVGQMPQILKQAGMKGIAFGRGVKAIGLDNEILKDSEYASKYSEIYWQSPDGTKLPAVVFMNWYSNGMEIPTENIKEYWERTLGNAEKYASTDELLLMNGCDHEPVQMNLSKALKKAREMYPDYNFIHSNFNDYIEACVSKMPKDMKPMVGELIGQDTDGWFSLVNTCSSNVDLKIANRKGELILEAVAEPLSVMATSVGAEYPHDMLLYSWKTLMKNHPHDSICCCSCDEVTAEMKTRFDKSRQATEMIIRKDLECIREHIDISAFDGFDATFAVLNTMSGKRSRLIECDVDIARNYCRSMKQLHETIKDYKVYEGEYQLVDEDGNEVSCIVTNRRGEFDYDLPKQAFRKPYIAERVTVSFLAEDVPSMGYKVYGLRKADKVAEKPERLEENVLENKYLRATINADGTINVINKETGREFKELLRFEDTGDMGHEYTYIPTSGEPVLSGNKPAKIELTKNEEFVTEYKVTVEMEIPEEGDDKVKEARATLMSILERKGGRSEKCVTLEIVSYITLAKDSKRLDIKTQLTNNAKDHRLRVLFPTGLDAKTHKAESVFEAAKRNNDHKSCWTYPSGCEHQQGFVTMSDENEGIGVCNIGLYEYETMGNTIAVTLLRSVGEMGDWGVFPTELSQVQKDLTFEYSIVPFKDEDDVYRELAEFQYPMLSTQVFEFSGKKLPNEILSWSGRGLKQTAFKQKMGGDDIIARWTNYTDKEQVLTIRKTDIINNLYLSNVIEEKLETLEDDGVKWQVKVKPYEILTLGTEKC